jgi:hypothetical protein
LCGHLLEGLDRVVDQAVLPFDDIVEYVVHVECAVWAIATRDLLRGVGIRAKAVDVEMRFM